MSPLASRTSSTSSILIEEVISFADAQARERALLEAARDLAPGEARALVWRTEKAIIVPRGMPGRDYFAHASAAVEALGYPVFERDTGGDLTPQESGIVNFSLCFRMDGDKAALKDAYLRLTAPVRAFLLERYGIEARLSAIPGAFCDGAYNIAIREKKLAGTAQRWKLLGGEGPERRAAVLAHVAIMADNNLPPAINALNAFYRAAGSDRHIILDRHVTLAEHLGRTIAAPGVARDLAAFVAAQLASGES